GIHRLVHQQPHLRSARGRQGGGRPQGGRQRARLGGAGLRERQASGRGRGPGPGIQGCRLRVARARLLHVPRHEQRDGAAWPAQRFYLQPQFRRAPGTRRAHAPGEPGDGRCRSRRRSHRRRARHLRSSPNKPEREVMQAFTVLEGAAAPLMRTNINTDIIIRIERLRDFEGSQLGPYAFESWRYKRDGSEDPAFVLNKPPYREAKILIAGDNFACGSSREAAVWALQAFGIRAVIAPSFGPIFYSNCFQNGVLPVVLPARIVEELAAEVEATQGKGRVKVDLE